MEFAQIKERPKHIAYSPKESLLARKAMRAALIGLFFASSSIGVLNVQVVGACETSVPTSNSSDSNKPLACPSQPQMQARVAMLGLFAKDTNNDGKLQPPEVRAPITGGRFTIDFDGPTPQSIDVTLSETTDGTALDSLGNRYARYMGQCVEKKYVKDPKSGIWGWQPAVKIRQWVRRGIDYNKILGGPYTRIWNNSKQAFDDILAVCCGLEDPQPTETELTSFVFKQGVVFKPGTRIPTYFDENR